MEIFTSYYESPIGKIEIRAKENFIVSALFVGQENFLSSDCSVIEECKIQLEEYFNGKRKEFALNILLEGTDFQKEVWNKLKDIPFGKTISYISLAKELGNPKAVRAVGAVNGKNSVLVILPCHRVIGNDGKLVGYAGELWRKKWLLEHEAKYSGKPSQAALDF